MAETNKPILLVVDDEEPQRDILYEVLSANFPTLGIQTAANGEEAYAQIMGMERKPHIVYADVIMPPGHGGWFLEKLITNPTGPIQIPTFVFTGTPDNEEAIKAMFYAQIMYTQGQREALQLVIQPHQFLMMLNLEEQRRDVEAKVRSGDYNFGFPVLPKPYRLDDLVDRTRKVLQTIYGIDTSPQS